VWRGGAVAIGCRAARRRQTRVRRGEPPEHPGREISTTYFVVEPSREQLEQLTRVADAGKLRVDIDSVFSLDAARAAFERVQAHGKRGKVVLEIGE
jgi:NADPH:quinone reductase-like Zn-dependent oxidoreductase